MVLGTRIQAPSRALSKSRIGNSNNWSWLPIKPRVNVLRGRVYVEQHEKMASRQRNVLRYNSTSEPDEKGGDNNGFVQVAASKPFDYATYTSDRFLNFVGIPKILYGASTSHRLWISCSVGIFICILLYEAIVCDFIYIFHRLCAFILPLFTLLCVYYWLALFYRRTWSVTSIYLLFCACYIGEVFIQCFTWDLYLPFKSDLVVDDNHSQPRHYNYYYYQYHNHHHHTHPHYYYHPHQPHQSEHQANSQEQQQQHQKIITSDTEEEASAVHLNGQSGSNGGGQQAVDFQFWGITLLVSTFNQFPLLLTLSIATYFSSLTNLRQHALVFFLVLFSRFLACTQLIDWPTALRPFIAYNCGVGGILVAKYMEATLLNSASPTDSPNSSLLLTHQDGKNSSIRRRRPSNATTIHGFTHKARRTSLPALSMHKNHLQSNQVIIPIIQLYICPIIITIAWLKLSILINEKKIQFCSWFYSLILKITLRRTRPIIISSRMNFGFFHRA